MTCVQTSRETMPRIEVWGLLDEGTSDADQWCSVRKGCANDPFRPRWVEKFLFTFHLTEKLKFNSRFPSLYASEARTKNKRINNQSVLWTVWLEGQSSFQGPHVFMHITKSLIKSTSNCRHRNQSQLPHPRHTADCESDCESSTKWVKNCQYGMQKVEKDKRNATEGNGSSAGPGESGALFYKFVLIKIPIKRTASALIAQMDFRTVI